MPWLFHTGWEDQASTGLFPADADQTPVVSSANPNSGSYHLRIPFDSNDLYSFSRTSDFAASSAGAARTLGVSMSASTGIENDLRIGLAVETGSTPSYAGFTIATSTGVVRAGAGNDANFTDTVLYTSPAGTFVIGEYIDLEIRWICDNTAGAWAFAINGVQVYSDSGLDTHLGAGTPQTGFGLVFAGDSAVSTSPNVDIDDLRVGESLSGLLGPMEHEWCAVDSAIENDGVGSDADSTDNHLLVDETPFSASDYVDLQNVNDRERYGVANRTLTGDIACVSVVCQAQQPSGSSTANTFLESNTTEEAGNSLILGAGSAVFRQYVENDPDTASTWTTSGFNAVTVGMEKTA